MRAAGSDWRTSIRLLLWVALHWLGDASAPSETRIFARDVVAAALKHLPDERNLTDVLKVLQEAVDRGDLVPLVLAEELPTTLVDGRNAEMPALVPLGNRAMARGAFDSLILIAHAALFTPTVTVPAEWIAAIVRAEPGDEPRQLVLDTVQEWLAQCGGQLGPVADALRDCPLILNSLRRPPEIPF